MRLLVLRLLEPGAFRLCPALPAIFLPWHLREHGHGPRRVTLFAFSLLTTCVVAPLVEELLRLVRAVEGGVWAGRPAGLSLNPAPPPRGRVGVWAGPGLPVPHVSYVYCSYPTPFQAYFRRALRSLHPAVPAPAPPHPAPPPPTATATADRAAPPTSTAEAPVAAPVAAPEAPLRAHMALMLASTLGLKVADNVKRVLLYSKPFQVPRPSPIQASSKPPSKPHPSPHLSPI